MLTILCMMFSKQTASTPKNGNYSNKLFINGFD